jgi:hypothetical protein
LGASLVNASGGEIKLGAGSSLYSDDFTNEGTFIADSSTVSVSYTYGTDDVGTLNVTNSTAYLNRETNPAGTALAASAVSALAGKNNVLNIYADIDNSGKTLDLNNGAGFKSLGYSGTISGGTITGADGALINGAQSDLTVEGPVTFSNGGALNGFIASITGVVFTGAGGTRQGHDQC